MRNRGFTLIELMIVIAIIAIIAAIAIPNLIEARKHGNEAAAIGALKTVTTSQTLFREGDKDSNDNLDYGTLTQLYTYDLIDQVLGSGTKQGFYFAAGPGTTSEFLWGAYANPALPGTTGDRAFCCNQAGVIYYTTCDEDNSTNKFDDLAGIADWTLADPATGDLQPVGK